MTRALATGCALAVAAVCLAQNQLYHAQLSLQGGNRLPSAPLFATPPAGRDLPPCNIVNAFDSGVVIYTVPVVADPGTDLRLNQRFNDKCVITIWLKGYRKATVTLSDGAIIALKPIGDPEGSTVSVTALHVPKEAVKAYDKALEAFSDGKLAAARTQLERAVALDPEYARAWSELGEVLEQQSRPKEAVQVCEHALKADPKYIRPYLQLMRLAVADKRMEDAAALGERALKLNPIEFPGIYYFDAAANYDLKHVEEAERSVRRAIDLDQDHDYPAAEALLGKLLADKGDARGAIDHFTKYLQLAPKAADAADIRRRIAELDRGGGKYN